MALAPLKPNDNMRNAIFAIIPSGRDNALSRQETRDGIVEYSCKNKTGIIEIGDRELRRYIRWLRQNYPKGSKICYSTKGGYFFGNKNDVKEHCARERARAKSINVGIQLQERMAILEFGEQMEIPF